MLIALLCGAVGIAALGAMDPLPKVISVDEIRTHRITLLDPHGGIAAAWYSDENGGLIGP